MNVSKYLFFLIILSNQAFANDNLNDSTKVNETVHQFFSWYLTSIQENKDKEYQPYFVESVNGNTTLEFSVYRRNLLENNCSEDFIQKEMDSYQECLKNLELIPFKDIGINTLTDIDEYEQLDCDFGNYYRWIDGMEKIQKIKIIETSFKNNSRAVVVFDCVLSSERDENIIIDSNFKVHLILINGVWKIDAIETLNVA